MLVHCPHPKRERTGASKRFNIFSPECERVVRTIKLTESLTEIKQAWLTFRFSPSVSVNFDYCQIRDALKHLKYSAEDVKFFSISMIEFQDDPDFRYKGGLFLSALINNGVDSEYVVITKHLDEPLDCLCYGNSKTVRLEGNAGTRIGGLMEEGTIHIDGSYVSIATGISRDGEYTRGLGKIYCNGELVFPK